MHRTLILLALVVSAACGSADVADETVTRTDSAGVKLVTSAAPDRELPWTFQQVGVLTDSLDEPWLFTGLTPQYVLTDRAGRTYVLEREPAIRRFGRDGRYERSIGRKGGAPGEMQFPTSLVQQGDSLGVVDVVRQAVVRWDADFEPIADIPLRDRLANTSRIAFRSGGLWAERFEFDSASARSILVGDTLGSAPLLSLAQPGGMGGTGKMLSCGGGGRTIAMRQPTFFTPSLHWAAQGPRVVANVGPDYSVLLFEGNRLLARIARELPSRAPTMDDARRLYPEGMKVNAGGIECTFSLDEITDGAQFAETVPFVHGLVLLSDGTIWVQRSFRNERPIVLDVFGSDGAYAGTVTGMHLPVGLLPNGELLVPMDDEDSGGLVITRMTVLRPR